MNRDRALRLLQDVANGTVNPRAALDELSLAPTESLPFATVDHHRALRQGYPEVIFGAGKSPEQCVMIAQHIAERGNGFLVTRASAESRAALIEHFPSARVNHTARTVTLTGNEAQHPIDGTVLVITAGTSDLAVAEEALETLRALGCEGRQLTDVGVAGIHRLLAKGDELLKAKVVIVVAGMDGALPSVVGGLVAAPVIAVPTSVGYGAAFEGLAPLLTMLNSCAAGVTVVNIDNGFGAAAAASRILRGA
ncbi:MAG: nickel pincer cofactor biosynthesis protein LarB [Gemmatimonadaceae bacterium]